MPSSRNLLNKFFFAFIFCVSMSSCSKDEANTEAETEVVDPNFTTNTRDTSFANSVVIKYDGTAATVTNPFSASGVTVAVSNSDVVVTSTVTTTEINYVISGSTTDGSFRLYSDYKFNLVLNGISIVNSDGPAINIQSGKKVSVNVLAGTNNRLVDGANYATSTEDQKAAFFSEGQLNFNGTGTLAVTGNYKHAICSDDYIVINDGNITVTKAVSDAIHANDYFSIAGGTITLASAGDGIDVEEGYSAITGGVINVTTTGEKANAIKTETYLTINSNDQITLRVSGQGSKGIKTGGDLTVTNGKIAVTTAGNAFYDAEDKDIAAAAAFNVDGNLLVKAGTLTLGSTGTGGKGITVDGTAVIDGGTISITASGGVFTYGSDGAEAKGFKTDGTLTINGGNISIAAADDGIKSETSVTINNGTINITKSGEGVEAPKITVNNGNISVLSSDDCFNSTNGNGGESNDGSLMTFAGGTVSLNSSGGDPMDSNGNIVMTGGTVIVQGPPSAPEVALDYNGTFIISGGLLIASGPNAGNMIQATSAASTQNTVLVKITGNVAANTVIAVQDASGNNLVNYIPAKNAYYFVFSSASLVNGTYKVLTGGTVSGGTSVNGLVTGGTYAGGTQKGSFTVSSRVTNSTM